MDKLVWFIFPGAYSRGTMANMKIQACRVEGGPSFFRPCVDCGRITGSFCDFCNGAERLPQEKWNENQGTPLCGDCDDKRGCCHFCEGKSWCRPPSWPPSWTLDNKAPCISTTSEKHSVRRRNRGSQPSACSWLSAKRSPCIAPGIVIL